MEQNTVKTRYLQRQLSKNLETKTLQELATVLDKILEFLAFMGPTGNFFFGLSTNQIWSMIEGMQLIAMYPLLHVDSPANLQLMQAVLRKISTFELIDGEIFEDYIWNYDLEEDIDINL